MPQPSSHFEQLNQIIEACTEDIDPSLPTSAISSSNNVNISFPFRSPSFHKQIDQPHVASPTTVPLKKSQAATTCVGRGGSNTNTTDRRFGKNNHTTPSSSPSRKATASLLQSNHKHAAVLSDTTQGRDPSTLSGSSIKAAHDAVSSNESTVLDNYPNNRKKQIQPIIHQFEKKKRSKSADPSFRSSKMSTAELRMDAALGSKKKIRPLNKKERREDWNSLIDLVATGYAESDPVDTTNTDSPTSASSNVGKADDLNEACDFSQNQSKCGYFFIFLNVVNRSVKS